MRKQKTKLIFTLSIALLSVLTMGVSTFAWFQAQADVEIRTEESSTTITVSKPDDFVFYAYKGNRNSSHDMEQTSSFAEDFTEVITSEQLAQETQYDGTFTPGCKKIFALKFTNHSSGPLVLEATNLLSETFKKASSGAKSRLFKSTQSYEINIGWAINIFSLDPVSVVDSSTDPAQNTYKSFVNTPTGTDRIVLSAGSTVIGTSNGGQQVQIDNNPDNIDTTYCKANGSIDLYRNNNCNITNGFLFYAIVFSDVPTDRYAEVSQNDNTPIIVPSTENTRYFINNSGSSSDMTIYNSNCFSNLKFHISSMTFTF